jgi:putative 4-mercaptohistidine N1-methyltranferase
MSNIYETDQLVSEYLLFHYGSPEIQMPWDFGPVPALNYPVRCVRDGFRLEELGEESRALDIGCAVGRSSFELARFCGEVVGIDFSQAFIRAAAQLAEQHELTYSYRVEGDRMESTKARLPAGIPPGRVQFEQGDAMDLRADLGSFDVVLAANLICRLTHPSRFLDRCRDLVRPGGQLVINTPFTWLREYTEPDQWVGAHPESGESLDALIEALEPDFEIERTQDLPFLIREHRRKYQWSVAQSCRFRRKP